MDTRWEDQAGTISEQREQRAVPAKERNKTIQIFQSPNLWQASPLIKGLFVEVMPCANNVARARSYVIFAM